MSKLREKGIPNIPWGTGNMSEFWEEWLRTGKYGLDGVMGGVQPYTNKDVA